MDKILIVLFVVALMIPCSCAEEYKAKSEPVEQANAEVKMSEIIKSNDSEEVWAYVEGSTNDSQWDSKYINRFIKLCNEGLADNPDGLFYCKCSLRYLMTKVTDEFLFSLKTKMIGNIVGRTARVYCD